MKRTGYAGLAFALASALLAACGGGGSSSAPKTPTPTPTPSGGNTCASFATSTSAGRRLAQSYGASGSWVSPNRLYVSYRSSAAASTARSVESVAAATRSIDAGTDGSLAHRLITLPDGADLAAVAANLRSTAGVVDVQPTHLRVPLGDAVANDQFLDNVRQWYLYKTNVDAGAWALTHGRSGVSVAVIDTGVDETNVDFVFDVRESVVGGVKATGAGTVQDTNGHGTNVAGLAVAQTNNSYGFAGVGYSTHLQAYRIFPPATSTSDCQTADSGDESVAIRDAVANGASVINLSIGSPQSAGVDAVEQSAIAYAIANGVTVVAAAGNEGGTSKDIGPDYPAAYPGVIAVGASAVNDSNTGVYGAIVAETVAGYSNSNPTLVAPGGDASSTSDNDVLHWIEGYSTTTAAYPPDQCVNSSGVCRVLFNGTSQATPQVTGAVALMLAYHGGARSLSPANVVALLQGSTDVLPGISGNRQGAGRLNTAKAVAAAHP